MPSKQYKDALGILQPQITYDVEPYTMVGSAARQTAIQIFQRMEPRTSRTSIRRSRSLFTYYSPSNNLNGDGHVMETYRMGNDPTIPVVDANLPSYDHKNLYMLGRGAFHSVGMANPTLTNAALALRAAKAIIANLGS